MRESEGGVRNRRSPVTVGPQQGMGPQDSLEQRPPKKERKPKKGQKNFLKGGRINAIKRQRESLPIFALKQRFLDIVAANQIIVVLGETGSGKTTQIPQYLLEAGHGANGKIGCTQPRRIAAASVAARVSEELGCELGTKVGYSIRFEDCCSDLTVIKYMTDGVLLQECVRDRDLKYYSVIILDEAHERTINTDVLFGLLKAAVHKREDLRLIISRRITEEILALEFFCFERATEAVKTATLDKSKFSRYFDNAPVFEVMGRTYPVDTIYCANPGEPYVQSAAKKVIEIHRNEPSGDILVFLTGQDEIENLCEILNNRASDLGSLVSKLIVLPLYSSLDSEEQKRIFEPPLPGARKARDSFLNTGSVVVATNIAESSLTVDGIVYVVDSGFVKQRIHKPKSGMDTLEVTPISQAQAEQRKGRAGRTAPGKCFRLYYEDFYRVTMPPSFVPEIQRTNLASIVLKLKAMGIIDVAHFEFMDPPCVDATNAAILHLHLLGALNDDLTITGLGKTMAAFPMDPSLAKLLVQSVDMGCSDEVLTIVSILSVQNFQRLYRRPKNRRDLADQKHRKFFQPEGDLLTLLRIYEAWRTNHYSDDWCFENYLSSDVLWTAQEIRGQLVGLMDRQKLPLINSEGNIEFIQKAICAGFFYNAAFRIPSIFLQGNNCYQTFKSAVSVYIRPGTALFTDRPSYVVYYETVKTKKNFMQQVTCIEPAWLNEFAPSFFELPQYGDRPVFRRSKDDDVRLQTIQMKFRALCLKGNVRGG